MEDLSNINKLSKFQRFFYDYGRYHSNRINVWIHVLCIPVIYVSLMQLLRFACSHYGIEYNLGWLIPILASPMYFSVDVITGILTLVVGLGGDLVFKRYDLSCPDHNLKGWHIWLILHLVSWIAQFIGHGIFEKRKPALMDNLLLTLNAPVFALLEVFELFGYRKEEIEETRKYINYDVQKYREKKF